MGDALFNYKSDPLPAAKIARKSPGKAVALERVVQSHFTEEIVGCEPLRREPSIV